MSAFVCNPHHIAAIAAYAVYHRCVAADLLQLDKDKTVVKVAEVLAKENIRSVCFRYEDISPKEYSWIIRDTKKLAKQFHLQNLAKVFGSSQIEKLASCLDYQCCETDDWDQTLAYKQVQHIRRCAADRVGADVAPWEI